MFGSSQDRARQLAYRARRDRVISSGSTSSYRSISSGSHPWQYPSVAEQPSLNAFLHDICTPEFRQKIRFKLDADLAAYSMNNQLRLDKPGSLPCDDDDETVGHSDLEKWQTEQQRLQARRLDVVDSECSLGAASESSLPSSPTTSTIGSPVHGSIWAIPRAKHTRNVTAPVRFFDPDVLSSAPGEDSSSLDAMLSKASCPGQSGTKPLPYLRGGADRSVSHHTLGIGTVDIKVLRMDGKSWDDFAKPVGSARYPEEDSAAFPWSLLLSPDRPYVQKLPLLQAKSLPYHWTTGISQKSVDYFKQSLESVGCFLFDALFGPYLPHGDWSGALAQARRQFVARLTPQTRDMFQQMVTRRLLELVEQEAKFQKLPQEHRERVSTGPVPGMSTVLLSRLLEGTEDSCPHGQGWLNGDQMRELFRVYLIPLGQKFSYYGSGGASQVSSATKTSLNKIFDKYREDAAGEPDAVGINGTMQYLNDTGVDLEGLESFAALEVVQAPAMGEMTRDGFVNGWAALNCDTIEKQKEYFGNLERTLPGDPEHFDRIYKFTFNLGLAGNSKQVPLEQAIASWDLLFNSPLSNVKWTSANTPWLEWWTEFMNTKHKKSVTKDMWNQTLKFAKLTLNDESLSFWNEESSWPAVIDEFVDYVKIDKRGGSTNEPMEEDY